MDGLHILRLFDPLTQIDKLKDETLNLIRLSKELWSIKKLVICAEIIDLTKEMNLKYRCPKGRFLLDEAAFLDLKNNAREIFIYADPERSHTSPWVSKIKKLEHYYNLQKEAPHAVQKM